ncbi:MAG TPA: hypothetical protein VM582_08650 [Candidatus Thermoplasmatota archaeon]|nr:hypothetical protein [Candidatus Thermoplasmatota archaeon]
MPENTPAGRSESPGQALRNWGREHPTLVALKTLLPSYPSDQDKELLDPGMYVDHLRTPWVAVRGEIRVSLARIICVKPHGRHQLVGQVQVTATEADLEGSVTLRFYLHQPAGVIAREVSTESEWWMGILDAHYAAGGAPVVSSDHGVRA